MKNLLLLCLVSMMIFGGCDEVVVEESIVDVEGIVEVLEVKHPIPDPFMDFLDYREPASTLLNPVFAYDIAKEIVTFKVYWHEIDWSKIHSIYLKLRKSGEPLYGNQGYTDAVIKQHEISRDTCEVNIDLSEYQVKPREKRKYDLRVVVNYIDGSSQPADVFTEMIFTDITQMKGTAKCAPKCYRGIEITLIKSSELRGYSGITVVDHKGRFLMHAMKVVDDIIQMTDQEKNEVYAPSLVDQWLDH